MALFKQNLEEGNRITLSGIGGNRHHKSIEIDGDRIGNWDEQKRVLKEMEQAGVQGLPNPSNVREREAFFSEVKNRVDYASKYGRSEFDLEGLLKSDN